MIIVVGTRGLCTFAGPFLDRYLDHLSDLLQRVFHKLHVAEHIANFCFRGQPIGDRGRAMLFLGGFTPAFCEIEDGASDTANLENVSS